MKKIKSEKGFTLIEMLIVLMIISVLIILIVPTLSQSSKEIDDKGCTALVSVVQAQVHLYQLEKKKLPDNLQDLVTEKYVTEKQITCSNNKKLLYTSETGIVSVQENGS